MKQCKICREEKELSDFHREARNLDGHMGICKVCRNNSLTIKNNVPNEEKLKRRAEYLKEYSKKYYKEKIKKDSDSLERQAILERKKFLAEPIELNGRTYKELTPTEKFKVSLLLLKKNNVRGGECNNDKYNTTSLATYTFIIELKNKIKELDPQFAHLNKRDFSPFFYKYLIDLYKDDNRVLSKNYFSKFEHIDTSTTITRDLKNDIIEIKETNDIRTREVICLLFANYFEHHPKWKKVIFGS